MDKKDLASVLQKHPEAIGDQQRLIGILRDYFPTERQNIRLLGWALEIDILREIRTNQLNQPLLLRLRKRMTDEFLLQQEKADWAVDMWSYAYGCGVLEKTMPHLDERSVPQSAGSAQPTVKSMPQPGKPLPPAQQPKPTIPSVQQQTKPAPQPVQQLARPAPPQKPAIDMSHFQLDASGRMLVKYVGPGGDVEVPPGVTHIGAHAFSPYASERDKQLKVIEGTIKGFIFHPIGSSCSNATIQSLPSFNSTQSHKAIKSVVLPQGVTSIGESAFADCYSLQRVVLPQGVRSIGGRAFGCCSSLQSISIPQGITQIENATFFSCSSLQKVILPLGVTRIGYYAFSGCKNLRQITIPPSVALIGSYAFSDCENLRQITIPPSVALIESGAFQNCSSLQRADVAPGTAFWEDAFAECSSLLAKPGGELATAGIDLSHFRFDEGCHVLQKYVGPGEDVIIPKGVTTIGNGAFSGCSSLHSVTIPAGVTWIGNEAFENCSNLQSITMPDGITYLGRGAFSHCSSLRHVTLPQGIKTIISWTFFDCSSLESVTIPQGVTKIGIEAFKFCSKLKSVTIPQGVTEIEECAFGNCFDLQSVTLPASVKEIGSEVFWRHKKWTWLIHPLTIYAPVGSYAQRYAKENRLRFQAV